MSDQDTQNNKSLDLSASWSAESTSHEKKPLFQPDELDIYCNKLSHEAFIFHGKIIDYKLLSHIVYDAEQYTMTVFYKDSRTQDLGVKVQWILRPYLKHAKEINIVRTENKASVDGTVIPLVHKAQNA